MVILKVEQTILKQINYFINYMRVSYTLLQLSMVSKPVAVCSFVLFLVVLSSSIQLPVSHLMLMEWSPCLQAGAFFTLSSFSNNDISGKISFNNYSKKQVFSQSVMRLLLKTASKPKGVNSVLLRISQGQMCAQNLQF